MTSPHGARPSGADEPGPSCLPWPSSPSGQHAGAVVLVEGASDRAAVLACARRRHRDLAAERVEVVVLGGATNMRAGVRRYGPAGLGLRLAGLYDAAEERFARKALADIGFHGDPAAAGFFRCDADLEDELIRALGSASVEAVLAEHGDLGAFRTLQQQPAQRNRTVEAQLHRFFGAGSGRKERYADLLVDRVPLYRMPAPLDAVLESVAPA